MREYKATVGATDGNIIAAIITTHTDRNQPKLPRPVQGPLSILRIWSAVHHQPTAATPTSRATRPIRPLTAANAGASPVPRGTVSSAVTVIRSGGPRELGLRKTRLPLVLDAEGVDPRPLGFGHGEVGAHRMEHPGEPDRLAGLHAEGDDVLHLE